MFGVLGLSCTFYFVAFRHFWAGNDILSFIMADDSIEVPRLWFEGEVGEEFVLPNISSPWLTKVFQLWNDRFDVVEASRPTDDFQNVRDMHAIHAESTDLDSKVDRKRAALLPVADPSPVQPHYQSSPEQPGISSSSVDSSMWNEASPQTEVVNQCTSCNVAQGNLIDYGRCISGGGI